MRMTRERAALLLGVEAHATAHEVNRAWRVWVKLAHPDAGGDRCHFEALAGARAVLLKCETPKTPAPDPGIEVPERPRLRSVCSRPSQRGMFQVMLVLIATVVLVLLAPRWPAFGAALAMGTAAGCAALALQRAVLQPDADTGHRISVLFLAWVPVVVSVAGTGALLGIDVIAVLPVIVLPFIVFVAMVNPGAGLWRPIRLPS